MPYSTNADAPPDVRQRFSGHCLTVWRTTLNDTLQRHDDEGRAWATAELAGQQCEDAKMTNTKAAMPTTEAAMRAHLTADPPAGHGMDAADMPMPMMAGRHAKMHDKGADHEHDEMKMTGVKFAEGSDSIIEGLAIPYSGSFKGRDLHGETFTKATDFALDWFPDEGRPFLYHHGLDESVKSALVGRQIEREERDIGQWVRVQLDKRSKYVDAIREMVDAGALSFSSGAMAHLVQTRKDGTITRWPWVELSGTPTPAEPGAVVYAVKSADAIEHLTAVKAAAALQSILDSDSGLESEPFAGHAERVTASLGKFADRVNARLEVRRLDVERLKSGRALSAANRAEIQEAIDAVDALVTHRARLADLLARSDPAATEAAKAVAAEYLRFLADEARRNGVEVPIPV